ncbi:MAG: hypothetical protein REI64_08380 [Pedobacter sp.]|uniref:hypothetical protein n=1 Tax=Pedobacter sp. TaxID=1411316 RepID=UPI0028067324|nr:hypothetical protein [Pedobacter sp.]MDQ8004799.1 hypothetical protein [Pedobacter sp.]
MKDNILFVVALVFALWFAATAYIWIYWAALIISYPIGIASFFIWRFIKKDGKKRNKIIPILLIAGLTLSLGILIFFTR